MTQPAGPLSCMTSCAKLKILAKRSALLCAGIFYGLYLTFSTWLLYFIATKTHFFADSIKMYSLNDLSHTLDSFCLDKIAAAGLDPLASACTAGKQYETAITAAFHDCACFMILPLILPNKNLSPGALICTV